MKYTIKHLRAEFGTDNKCLQFVFDNRYGKKFECPQCQQKGKFYLIEGRKRFDCVCGYTVSPLADTIFHKSSTPLTLWFHAIFLFANSRNGVAAKELERQLGVTYKCAWRLAKQIRILFAQAKNPLSGTIETDELRSYSRVASNGYLHETVKHGAGEYVRGEIHTNNIEGFWSQLKRSISGTHHAVSPKYLQLYLDEFVWRYNYRGQVLFPLMMLEAVKPVSIAYEKNF